MFLLPGDNLVNSYLNALQVMAEERVLRDSMKELGISSVSVFTDWLQEERAYLLSLKKEPEIETDEMEYLQKLMNLYALE